MTKEEIDAILEKAITTIRIALEDPETMGADFTQQRNMIPLYDKYKAEIVGYQTDSITYSITVHRPTETL